MPDPLIACDSVEFSYAVPAPRDWRRPHGGAGLQSGEDAAPGTGSGADDGRARDPRVLRGISLTVSRGEHLAIIGPNGSGKSTLARHLNALLRPHRGTVRVRGMDTRDPAHLRSIRQTVGMVFQHPESQMVATTVEEDVAFGPENLGVPHAQLRRRVPQALEIVGMWEARDRPPHLLSAGQKQRVAIAGVLAMQPECVVLDEATSLLDPRGRAEVAQIVLELRRRGTAVVSITHLMSEATVADRAIVLDRGWIWRSGTPREVFADAEALHGIGLDVPPVAALASRVRRWFPTFPAGPLTVEEMVEAVAAYTPVPR